MLNGAEIGGGSIRIHDANTQRYVFENILQVRFQIVNLCVDFLKIEFIKMEIEKLKLTMTALK